MLEYARVSLSQLQTQVQHSGAAQNIEDRLPRGYRTREQRVVNNSFPFSCHDNRHCLQNVGEYFDFVLKIVRRGKCKPQRKPLFISVGMGLLGLTQGMGRRKVEPERRQQNSQNFFLWAHESIPSSEDGLTIYQTSFVKDLNTESPFCRRYPKHHLEKCCTDKPVPENEKNCSQTSHLNYKNTFVALTYHH